MKSFVKLLRRYVLAAVVCVLLLIFTGIGVLVWLGFRENDRNPWREHSSGKIADAMVESVDGFSFGEEYTPEEWMDGYEWAMILNDDGDVAWSYELPEGLNRHYTTTDVAKFSRWYLDDYPVFCWTEDYGLFVIGAPKGSVWKYNFYSSPAMLKDFMGSIFTVVISILLLVIAFCFWLSERGAKAIENMTRRDNVRTQWIAGVSHDVRTPLALILGWAEQMERDVTLSDAAREKAGSIRMQSEKIRTLIADLNLTSKLQYGAQPLRKELFTAGPLFRKLVAEFCDSPVMEQCGLELVQTEAAEHARIQADQALLERLLNNLLGNSIRHNQRPVTIEIKTDVRDHRLCLTITDDGEGYPQEILQALKNGSDEGADTEVHTLHILGLHVVEQIAAAHGGCVIFENTTKGAKTEVWLPVI